MNMTEHEYFEKAKQIALISDCSNMRAGCIAVYKNHIIGIGCNYKNQSVILPHFHAEINCLNQIQYLNIDFSQVRLYITCIAEDGSYEMACPCQSCWVALKKWGIKHIYYTTASGFAYEFIGD